MNINDIYQFESQLINQYLWLIVLALVMLAVSLYLNRRNIKNGWLRLKTRYCLRRLGLKQLSDIQFPDGMGHYFTVDRLIMRHDGITLLINKRYPGKIFCAEHIDDWTQMLGRKSYRFRNPLYELDTQIKTISSCIPNVDVDGYLFFDQMAEFPKGHPERVIYLNTIPQQLIRNRKYKVEKPVAAAWQVLQHKLNSPD